MDLPFQPAALVAIFGGTALVALLALRSALSRKEKTEDQARAYLAGFTYVLSDDPDAAIAELSKAAQLDTQTLETYFALGALFRRKGELERAIRLHRNILLRPGIAPEIRRRAQFALALDYKRSLLIDKAAEAFEKLLAEDPENREALLRYRQVLEEAQDWSKAIEIQVRLIQLEGKGENVLGHLLAEASRSLLPLKPDDAESLATRATELHPRSADAQLALSEVRLARGGGRDAASPLRMAIRLEPELAPRATRLLAATASDALEVERFLRDQIATHPSSEAPFELALALHLKEESSADRAIAQLRELVDRKPRFWEARKELGALLLAQNREEELRAEYRDILATLGQPAMGFVCSVCRQKLPGHLFRCPSCESWDTVLRE